LFSDVWWRGFGFGKDIDYQSANIIRQILLYNFASAVFFPKFFIGFIVKNFIVKNWLYIL